MTAEGVKGGVPIDTASGSFAVTRAVNRATGPALESPLAGNLSPINWALRLAKYNSRLVSAQHLLDSSRRRKSRRRRLRGGWRRSRAD